MEKVSLFSEKWNKNPNLIWVWLCAHLKYEIFSTHKAFPYTVYLYYIIICIIYQNLITLMIIYIPSTDSKNLYTFFNIPHEI